MAIFSQKPCKIWIWMFWPFDVALVVWWWWQTRLTDWVRNVRYEQLFEFITSIQTSVFYVMADAFISYFLWAILSFQNLWAPTRQTTKTSLLGFEAATGGQHCGFVTKSKSSGSGCKLSVVPFHMICLNFNILTEMTFVDAWVSSRVWCIKKNNSCMLLFREEVITEEIIFQTETHAV